MAPIKSPFKANVEIGIFGPDGKCLLEVSGFIHDKERALALARHIYETLEEGAGFGYTDPESLDLDKKIIFYCKKCGKKVKPGDYWGIFRVDGKLWRVCESCYDEHIKELQEKENEAATKEAPFRQGYENLNEEIENLPMIQEVKEEDPKDTASETVKTIVPSAPVLEIHLGPMSERWTSLEKELVMVCKSAAEAARLYSKGFPNSLRSPAAVKSMWYHLSRTSKDPFIKGDKVFLQNPELPQHNQQGEILNFDSKEEQVLVQFAHSTVWVNISSLRRYGSDVSRKN
jgi:hypothetical protein